MNFKRIEILDYLRGFFLFVIIVDHLGRYPGVFEVLTGKGWLWVSAAEGFFFISGILLGLIRGKKEKILSLGSVSKKLVKRSILLYGISVVLTILFTIFALENLANPTVKEGWEFFESFETLVFRAATLDYVYGWADYLQYYAVYLFFSPLAIFLLRKKLWSFILLVSSLLWFCFRESSMLLGWQILFFGGMIIGYYLPEIINYFNKLKPIYRRMITFNVLNVALITFVASNFVVHFKHYFLDTYLGELLLQIDYDIAPYFFDKATLPFSRIALFLCWFLALVFIFNKLQKILAPGIRNFLLILGKNSLFVYILQSIFIFIIDINFIKSENFFENILITVSILFLIYLCAEYQNELKHNLKSLSVKLNVYRKIYLTGK